MKVSTCSRAKIQMASGTAMAACPVPCGDCDCSPEQFSVVVSGHSFCSSCCYTVILASVTYFFKISGTLDGTYTVTRSSPGDCTYTYQADSDAFTGVSITWYSSNTCGAGGPAGDPDISITLNESGGNWDLTFSFGPGAVCFDAQVPVAAFGCEGGTFNNNFDVADCLCPPIAFSTIGYGGSATVSRI